MSVRCVDCERFSLRHKSAELAKRGCGTCPLYPGAGQFVTATYRRTCEHFTAAPADLVARRIDWLGWLKSKADMGAKHEQ